MRKAKTPAKRKKHIQNLKEDYQEEVEEKKGKKPSGGDDDNAKDKKGGGGGGADTPSSRVPEAVLLYFWRYFGIHSFMPSLLASEDTAHS